MFDLSGTLAEAFGWSIAQYNYRSGQVGTWPVFSGIFVLWNFEILNNFPCLSVWRTGVVEICPL